MEDIQKILNTIALLKNLKDRPGTPEEAAAAAAKIQALMTKHNLSVFQVDAATRTLETAGPQVIRDIRYTTKTEPWRTSLLHLLAKVNYVTVLRDAGYRYILIGHEHNVPLVWNLFDYLEREIDRLSRKGWKEHTPQNVWRIGKHRTPYGDYVDYGWFPETESAWRNDFRMGAANTVYNRLLEERDRVVEKSGGSALMVIAEQEVQNKLAEWYPDARAGRKFQHHSATGWDHGREAGKTINLAKQIGG